MQVSVRTHTSSETANSSLNQLWFTRERVVLGPHKPACPVGDVPGFASTGTARDRESAAYSGDAGEIKVVLVSALPALAGGGARMMTRLKRFRGMTKIGGLIINDGCSSLLYI